MSVVETTLSATSSACRFRWGLRDQSFETFDAYWKAKEGSKVIAAVPNFVGHRYILSVLNDGLVELEYVMERDAPLDALSCSLGEDAAIASGLPQLFAEKPYARMVLEVILTEEFGLIAADVLAFDGEDLRATSFQTRMNILRKIELPQGVERIKPAWGTDYHGVLFDVRDMCEREGVDGVIIYKASSLAYEKDGAVWVKSAKPAEKRQQEGSRFLPRLADQIFNQPLLIEQNKLSTILSVLGERVGLHIEAPSVEVEEQEAKRYEVIDGVAVIPVVGTLVHRTMGLEAMSGLKSYQEIDAQISEAMADSAVRSILLDIDSGGGEAAGAFELAEKILAAREVKPVWAISNEASYSAAYAIGAAAEKLFVTKTSGVGSIGVVSVHVDTTARDKMEGFKFNYIYAGDRKIDGTPHKPLSKQTQNILQQRIDSLYGVFAEFVARARGLTEEWVRNTEAGLFFGQDAVEAGLADAVMSFDAVLQALKGKDEDDEDEEEMSERNKQVAANLGEPVKVDIDGPAVKSVTLTFADPSNAAVIPADGESPKSKQLRRVQHVALTDGVSAEFSRESLGAEGRIQASEDGFEIVVIRSGMSKNRGAFGPVYYSPEALREATVLFEGAPINLFSWEKCDQAKGVCTEVREHLPAFVSMAIARGLIPSPTQNVVGFLRGVEYDEEAEALVARKPVLLPCAEKARDLIDVALRTNEGWQYVGVSIDADVFCVEGEQDGVAVTEVKKIEPAKLWLDIVDFPAAGGGFRRISESLGIPNQEVLNEVFSRMQCFQSFQKQFTEGLANLELTDELRQEVSKLAETVGVGLLHGYSLMQDANANDPGDEDDSDDEDEEGDEELRALYERIDLLTAEKTLEELIRAAEAGPDVAERIRIRFKEMVDVGVILTPQGMEELVADETAFVKRVAEAIARKLAEEESAVTGTPAPDEDGLRTPAKSSVSSFYERVAGVKGS